MCIRIIQVTICSNQGLSISKTGKCCPASVSLISMWTFVCPVISYAKEYWVWRRTVSRTSTVTMGPCRASGISIIWKHGALIGKLGNLRFSLTMRLWSWRVWIKWIRRFCTSISADTFLCRSEKVARLIPSYFLALQINDEQHYPFCVIS